MLFVGALRLRRCAEDHEPSMGVAGVYFDQARLTGVEISVEGARPRIVVGPIHEARRGPLIEKCISDVLLVDLTTTALGALLRLGARRPRSATVLCSGVLGLDALIAHGFYDTYCLR